MFNKSPKGLTIEIGVLYLYEILNNTGGGGGRGGTRSGPSESGRRLDARSYCPLRGFSAAGTACTPTAVAFPGGWPISILVA